MYKNTNVYVQECANMIWYDMIMRYVMEYGMKYDMRYDVIWDHMMWHMGDMEWYDVIYTVGKKGKLAVIPLILPFLHTVYVASGVLRLYVCVCVWLVVVGWVGVGCLRRCIVTLGPLIFSSATTGGCLNNPISYSGKYAACWAYFMRHHGLRPTAVSHPFSSLHISYVLLE